MEELLNIIKSGSESVFITLLILVGTFCPGLLIIYMFKYDLFISMDIFKILFLSLSITLPLLMMNITIYAITYVYPQKKISENKNKHNELMELILHSLGANFLILNTSILFVWKNRFSSNVFVSLIFLLEGVYVFYVAKVVFKKCIKIEKKLRKTIIYILFNIVGGVVFALFFFLLEINKLIF